MGIYRQRCLESGCKSSVGYVLPEFCAQIETIVVEFLWLWSVTHPTPSLIDSNRCVSVGYAAALKQSLICWINHLCPLGLSIYLQICRYIRGTHYPDPPTWHFWCSEHFMWFWASVLLGILYVSVTKHMQATIVNNFQKQAKKCLFALLDIGKGIKWASQSKHWTVSQGQTMLASILLFFDRSGWYLQTVRWQAVLPWLGSTALHCRPLPPPLYCLRTPPPLLHLGTWADLKTPQGDHITRANVLQWLFFYLVEELEFSDSDVSSFSEDDETDSEFEEELVRRSRVSKLSQVNFSTVMLFECLSVICLCGLQKKTRNAW